ncbi:hypothetical protein BJF93_18260 [Xaviernesmea oryzae]|uniref:Lipoprotein n=1 Tax=Xaviernesmea oryzae TaxID=464029 RepID=A0A1Q9ATK5_9HYPH|nr:hypothetical protein [Xaviernesmea oryzae]OLP58750.1 hypothetical protein BJF93_18260 [Xaviernesmea oryzae]SEK71930.1 hypothetical protein SAMN04487976_103363 [Xaviernesmea oryzae]
MEISRQMRSGTAALALLASGLVLSGCVGGPTYGTDKTAGEHLMDDLGNVVSMEGQKPKNLKYQPRPGLVMPPSSQKTALVQPQTSLASKDNPQWLESPEETRQRLRDEATENANSSTYVSPLAKSSANSKALTAEEQQAAYREARRTQMGAYSDKRRFLSDPPLAYRAVSEDQINDLGEPEQDKERRRKKEAEVDGTGRKWWQVF